MEIGELIQRTRLEEGMTQADLAARTGTTQPAIARLESGTSNPRFETVRRALGAMGRRLSVEALEPAPAPADDSLIRAHLGLTPEERLRAHEAASVELRDLMSRVEVLR